MPICSTSFKNFERLSTHDLLSYEQLSCDTILTSIHKQLLNLYDLYDEYFRTLNDVINKLGFIKIWYVTWTKTTKEYSELFINEYVNKEQEIIDRLLIISSSDSILIEPVEELCERIKQPSTLPLLLAHIDFAHYLAKVNKWILLLMNSIAQRKSIRMAIWGLNCLMLSTCPSHKTTNAL
ncbi:unnamed protein product [Rotaria sordida]|uniref:Uncharacterized protein n=1 Tax=Rotaria sordida TaxID=392033 RepID=A0A815CBP2_9BILA|nr:unnamed protein product [Rotaria sordida]